MKPKFVRCGYCKAEIPEETCKLASHRRIIDGREYLFCCAKCAERFLEKKKS
jgi:YHS domain-containing protein